MEVMYSTMRMLFFRHFDVYKMATLTASHEIEMCALKQQRFEEIGMCLRGTLLRGAEHPQVYLLIAEPIDKSVSSDRHVGEWFVPAGSRTHLRCPVCGQADAGFIGTASCEVKYTGAGDIVDPRTYGDINVSPDYSKTLHCIRCDYEANISKFEMGNWKAVPSHIWQSMLRDARR